MTWPDFGTPPGLVRNTTEVLQGSHKLVWVGPGMEDDLAGPWGLTRTPVGQLKRYARYVLERMLHGVMDLHEKVLPTCTRADEMSIAAAKMMQQPVRVLTGT